MNEKTCPHGFPDPLGATGALALGPCRTCRHRMALETAADAGRAWGKKMKVGGLEADGISRYAVTAYNKAILAIPPAWKLMVVRLGGGKHDSDTTTTYKVYAPDPDTAWNLLKTHPRAFKGETIIGVDGPDIGHMELIWTHPYKEKA